MVYVVTAMDAGHDAGVVNVVPAVVAVVAVVAEVGGRVQPVEKEHC